MDKIGLKITLKIADANFQSWAIGSWDRYSSIPVLPEVNISTDYLNTGLFKKLPLPTTKSDSADFR